MTDALWNGIIGAGGAAICCAVYYGFKAIRLRISKFKFNASSSKAETSSPVVQPENQADSSNQSKGKSIVIKIPPLKCWFTRNNIRALGFIILAIICFNFDSYSSREFGEYELFEGEYYYIVARNTKDIALNTFSICYLLSEASRFFFNILGGLFVLLGVTTFSLKKRTI